MKQLLLLTTILAALPSVSEAQSDLRKIGKFLQGIQEFQNQQDNGNQQQPPPNQSETPLPYKVDPNSSGNQNRGSFDGRGFFNPQNGSTYPQQQFPQQFVPQTNYPQQTFPSQQTYPGQNGIYQGPIQPAVAPKNYSNQPIVIRCDSDVVGICQYELLTARNTTFPYAISGGQSQNLTENTDWAFRYRPSPNAAYKTYRLRGGKTYEMRKSGNAWQFYMLP